MAANTEAENMATCETQKDTKSLFKSLKRKRPIRRRTSTNSDADAQDATDGNSDGGRSDFDKMQETIELQKLRKRAKGVNVATLASGKKITKIDEMVNNDPDVFKLKSGGLLTLDKARIAKSKVDEEDGVGDVVGTQFSKETQIRDEDEEMRKFIEKEMEKRRQGGNKEDENSKNRYLTPEEAALAELPTHLKGGGSKKSEEMLSSQMLSGIPEVDLGIEEKIRNIEATEMAKKKAAESREKKKLRDAGKPSAFVPKNLAVNFKHHNRFKPEEETEILSDEKKRLGASNDKSDKKQGEKVVQRTVVVGQHPEERVVAVGESVQKADPTRATDDIHLKIFKRHFQRK